MGKKSKKNKMNTKFHKRNQEPPLGKISTLLTAHLRNQGNGPRRSLLNLGGTASTGENHTARTVTSTAGSSGLESTQAGSNQCGADRKQSSYGPNNTQIFRSYNRTWTRPSGPYTENTTQRVPNPNKNRPEIQHSSFTEQNYNTESVSDTKLYNETGRPTGPCSSNSQGFGTQNHCNDNVQHLRNEPWNKIVSYYNQDQNYDLAQQPNKLNINTPGSSDPNIELKTGHPHVQQSNKVNNIYERIIIPDDYPFTQLDFDKFDDIQVAIFKKLENAPEPLPIISMKFDEKGYIPVTCKGARSINFIQSFNGQTITDNLKIKIVSANNLPEPIKMVWKTQNIICTDTERLMTMLQRCNPDLRTLNWRVIDTLPEKTHVRRIIMVDGVSAAYIQSKNNSIPDGLGQSTFKILLDSKKPKKKNKSYYCFQEDLWATADETEHLNAPLDDSVIIKVDTTPTIDLTNEGYSRDV